MLVVRGGKILAWNIFKRNSNNCVNNFIAIKLQLQFYCYNTSMRHTKTREEILYFLQKNHQAFTPYEIAQSLNINPVTVYRVLEFLKSQKQVHHIPSLGKWSHCQCSQKVHEDHGFMICRKCESVQEFTTPHSCLNHHGFQCEEHITEILGVCRKCQQ